MVDTIHPASAALVQGRPTQRTRRRAIRGAWRIAASLVLGSASWFASVCGQTTAAHAATSARLTLHIPYPITGPREIQASDRSTRHYRALSARTAPPITDTMAGMVEAALWSGADIGLNRTRRDDALALAALVATTHSKKEAAADLLLAGDDILRASAVHGGLQAQQAPEVIEPLADMPFVLICVTMQCRRLGRIVSDRRVFASLRLTSIGTTGDLGTSTIAARAWSAQFDTRPLLVPYNGGNGILGDLVAGRIDAAFVALPLAIGHLGHGTLKAIALTGERRFERLPDLPTLAEAGAPLAGHGWFAVFGSTRLPAAVAARAQAAIQAYRTEEASRAELLARGLTPSPDTPAQLSVRIRTEIARLQASLR